MVTNPMNWGLWYSQSRITSMCKPCSDRKRWRYLHLSLAITICGCQGKGKCWYPAGSSFYGTCQNISPSREYPFRGDTSPYKLPGRGRGIDWASGFLPGEDCCSKAKLLCTACLLKYSSPAQQEHLRMVQQYVVLASPGLASRIPPNRAGRAATIFEQNGQSLLLGFWALFLQFIMVVLHPLPLPGLLLCQQLQRHVLGARINLLQQNGEGNTSAKPHTHTHTPLNSYRISTCG
mmetsp:Transcript_27414/g.77389  ORF Transcript_27414/g.77389 Transcript_27414/m.77389 type:complete len:234 (-) Transcript_27414:3060-3761(-)